MATIEERAKAVFPNPTRLSSKQRRAYAIGATEQKAIDAAECVNQVLMGKGSSINCYKQGFYDAIEKACEWIKENFEYYVDVEVSSYYTYDDKFVDDFRTFMEESHK